MSVPCTKEVILTLIEDIELIAKEMIENTVAPKQKRMSAVDHKAMSDLWWRRTRSSKDVEWQESRERGRGALIDKVRAGLTGRTRTHQGANYTAKGG